MIKFLGVCLVSVWGWLTLPVLAQRVPETRQDSIHKLTEAIQDYRVGKYRQALAVFEKYEQATYQLPLEDIAQFLKIYEHCYRLANQAHKIPPLRDRFAKVTRDKPTHWQHFNELGAKACRQRKFYKAIECWTKGLALAAKEYPKDHPNYAVACTNLAIAYRAIQDYPKAEPLYMEARNIYKKHIDTFPLQYANLCNDLGLLYYLRQDYAKAKPLYEEAKQLRKKTLGATSPIYAMSCNNLGILYRDWQQYRAAEKCFTEVKNILSQHLAKDPTNYGAVCHNLGILYEQQQRFAQAERLYKEGLKVVATYAGKAHPDYTSICRSLAGFYAAQQEYSKAAPLYHTMLENVVKDVQRNLPYASETERARYWQHRVKPYWDDYNTFAVNYDYPKELIQMYRLQLLSKSLLFRSAQKTKQRILQSQDTLLIRRYHQLLALKEDLNESLTQTKAVRQQQGIQLEQLQEQITRLSRQVAQQSSAFAQQQEEYTLPDWREIKKHLKTGEVAIEMVRLTQPQLPKGHQVQYAALMVTPKCLHPELVLLKNGDFLETKAYNRYRLINIVHRARDDHSYRNFWAPIAQRLQEVYPKVSRAYVSVDGVYHLISLGSLKNPETGKYLADELDIRLVPNTKKLLPRLSQPAPKASTGEAWLFGFPAYDYQKPFYPMPSFVGFSGDYFAEVSALPGTYQEIDRVEDLLQTQVPCRVFWGRQASETNLKQIKSPRILHLATHGFFLSQSTLDALKGRGQTHLGGIGLSHYYQNPLLRTGLLWAGAQQVLAGAAPDSPEDNALLTAQEVENLSLDSTELVVLSACDTGLGEINIGQGVKGLQQAFLQAGARAVIMTLWEIEDDVTPWFMQYFYEAWLHHHNVRQAYRTAQARLRQHFPSPYYWAVFVLIER